MIKSPFKMLEKMNNRVDSRNLNGLFEIRRDIRLTRYDMCKNFLVKVFKSKKR